MMFGNFIELGVVPIFVNAGAALAPAIVAGFATFFSLLFKPKALFKFCKEKPWVPLTLAVIGALIGALIYFWPAPGKPTAGAARGRDTSVANTGASGGVYVDWTAVALARIEAKAKGGLVVEAPAAEAVDSSASVALEEAFIFRGNSLRQGAIGAAPSGELKELWSYYPSWVDLDGTVEKVESALMLSTPAVFGDRIFAGSCELDPPDSYGIFFCVDATTGETVWSVDQIDGEELYGFFSSPAVTADGRYVIVGQGLHPDTNCKLICFDAQDGTVMWTVETELHIESSPAIEDGVVYVGAGAIEDPVSKQPISHPGYVFSVRIEDGEVLWEHDVNDPESSPIVQDGVVYIGSGFNGKAVVALRAAADLGGEPRELWRTETPYPITGAVTLMDGKVYVGGGNGDFVFRDPNPAGVIMCLDAATGEIQWSTEMPDAVLGAVAAGDVLVAPVAAGEVTALNPADGSKVWSTAISGKSPVLAGASVADGRVYAVSSDGYMGILSLEDGALIDRIYINEKTRPGEQGLSISSPMISNGRLYVGSETGGLRCYVGE